MTEPSEMEATDRPARTAPPRRGLGALALAAFLVVAIAPAAAGEPARDSTGDAHAPERFLGLLLGGGEPRADALAAIERGWAPAYVPMALETLRFARGRLAADVTGALERGTGESFEDLDGWWRWWWARELPAHPRYASFKSALYAGIDPRFAGYFDDDRPASIRLDEARWGGVRQDGIPPLREPAMLEADEAGWLADTDVVFGIEIDGDARAYPKRVLAWHEMFVDAIGGTEIAGVYCTLCGAVIAYETVDGEGTRHALGTSGFLYRSNKLMYDRATQSLWSTTRGEPVIGPLVASPEAREAGGGIRLARRPVVTTTWGEWRRRHPDTTVLDIETGHRRDYAEGAAYRDYFATDELMFAVPGTDDRLANKAEVLALRFPEDVPGREDATLAIDAAFLRTERVHADALGGVDFVVLTDDSGANRVYETDGVDFADYDGDASVTDAHGAIWTLDEAALRAPDGRTLARLPAHRAFWFGWVAAYPETRLTS